MHGPPRVIFKFGVIYQTSLDQLKKIPQIVEDIITNTPETSFDRNYFASYGKFSLNIESIFIIRIKSLQISIASC